MSQTSDRYAQALFEIACEQNDLEALQAALSSVANLIVSSQDLQRFLDNPLFSFEERSTILKALFEGKIPDLAFKFILFVTYKNRLKILNEIIASFDTLYTTSTHQLRARIETAFPIKEEDKARYQQKPAR